MMVWRVKHHFRTRLSLHGDTVVDASGSNPTIQKLTHILTKLPEQTAILHILVEAEGTYAYNYPVEKIEKAIDEIQLSNAYLGSDDRPIKLRPSLADELLEQYLPTIEAEIQNIEIDGAPLENIRKIANAITEDPDIFN